MQLIETPKSAIDDNYDECDKRIAKVYGGKHSEHSFHERRWWIKHS